MRWVSDHQEVGNGAQWIVESESDKMVKSEMKFGDLEGHYYATFALNPVTKGSKVT